MMAITHIPPSKGLSIGELVEVGERLSESLLKSLGLLEKVMTAEREGLWRLRAAAELLRPLDAQRSAQLDSEAEELARQIEDPTRGTAVRSGITSIPRERNLPPAGTLIIKEHAYQSYNAPHVKTPDGSLRIQRFTTFKFLVIDERGELLLLGDNRNVIHGSPSAAARAATGNQSEKGWAFFGIKKPAEQ